MARRKVKRRHDVQIGLKNKLELTVAGSALTLFVRDNGKRLGVSEVGQGSIIWWGRSRKIGKRIGWNELARLLDNATGREIRIGG